jgi:hypothetical protein
MTPELLERVLDAAFTEITKLSAENAQLRAELATLRSAAQRMSVRFVASHNFTEPNRHLQAAWLDSLNGKHRT